MTDMDLRERLAALEVEMRHMREAAARQTEEMRELRDAVASLRDLLTQARGARWAIVTAIGVGSAIATYAPGVLKWAWAIR